MAETPAAAAPLASAEQPPASPPPPAEIDGYSRLGPGPLPALRFRWMARLGDDGFYYVDESIGLHSQPVTTGPMEKDEVLAFIDARERDARQRFAAIKDAILSRETAQG